VIYARNVDEESDYGELRYTLSCPVRENELCRVAKILANALSFIVPGMGDALKNVAKAFSAASHGSEWSTQLTLHLPKMVVFFLFSEYITLCAK